MTDFHSDMILKAKGAKSAKELLELAAAEGIDITADEAATYFAQLHPASDELSEDELDGVSGGGCISDLPLFVNYSMVKEFFCTKCFRVYPAEQCKVMHFEDKDDIAYCPTCQGEVFPAEEFVHGKV